MHYSNNAAKLPLPRLTEKVLGSGSCFIDPTGAVAEKPDGLVRVLIDPALEEEAGIVAAFSERTGGVSKEPYRSLNVDIRMGGPADVHRNRALLLDALGIGPDARLVVPVQVHGTMVGLVVSSGGDAKGGPGADALLSGLEPREGLVPIDLAASRLEDDVECDAVLVGRPGVAALLCFADCVPVILAAPGGAFCVVHAGWRGTIESIPVAAVRALADLSGADPSGFNAYIGPHIGSCCYEVDPMLAQRFMNKFGSECLGGPEGRNLDLGRCNALMLREAGVSAERIADAGVCTADSTDRFFSHRAENGRTGRFAAVCYRKSSEEWQRGSRASCRRWKGRER